MALKDEPYRRDNGVIILETNDLCNFFNELISTYNDKDTITQSQKDKVMEKINFFQNAQQKDYDAFIDDTENRRKVYPSNI